MAFLFCLSFSACQNKEDQTEKENKLLATVYNKSLFMADLEGMFSENMSAADSILLLNTLVERWSRDMVLMHEAEKHIPKDLNISKLVQDYRASLIRYNYEKLLVEIELDSTITEAELFEYYDKNKGQYQLESTIIRCHFIKIPHDIPDLDQMRNWWNSNNEEEYGNLLEFCTNFAEVYMLEDSTWYAFDDIASQLPKGTLTAVNLNSKKDFTLKSGDYQYLLRIFDTISKKEIAPLAFIEDQARRVILHKRKIKLLEDKKEEMYERDFEGNNVKFYTQ